MWATIPDEYAMFLHRSQKYKSWTIFERAQHVPMCQVHAREQKAAPKRCFILIIPRDGLPQILGIIHGQTEDVGIAIEHFKYTP